VPQGTIGENSRGEQRTLRFKSPTKIREGTWMGAGFIKGVPGKHQMKKVLPSKGGKLALSWDGETWVPTSENLGREEGKISERKGKYLLSRRLTLSKG